MKMPLTKEEAEARGIKSKVCVKCEVDKPLEDFPYEHYGSHLGQGYNSYCRDCYSPKPTDIYFWTRHDSHGYCSNFYRSPIEIDGKVYPTVEHWYQASKTPVPDEHEMIRSLPTPRQAKFAGYHVALRPDWEEVKEEVMLVGLRAKFTQYLDLKLTLISTGDAALHENSPWDKYWGYAKGKGQDRLGILLMQVREELKAKG